MGVTLAEGLILKKYSDMTEILQLQFDLPPLTTIRLTYEVPKGYIFLPMNSVQGEVVYYYGRISVWVDGTIIWDNIRSTDAWRHWMEGYDLRNAKREMVLEISNDDIVTHTVDFAVLGILIPETFYNEFVDEITGNDIKKLLTEIRNMLKVISFGR
jgi:hypothetical protein